MFAQFVGKLASVAGYQQLRVVKSGPSTSVPSESEDEDAFDIQSDDANQDQEPQSRGAILMFIEDPAQPLVISFPGGCFEIAHFQSGTFYRFVYPAGANRTYEVNPKDFGLPKPGRIKYLVKNVMLQILSNKNARHVLPGHGGGGSAAGVFVDLAVVDVFVDLETKDSMEAFSAGRLHQEGFR